MVDRPRLLDTVTLSEVVKGRDSSVLQRAHDYLAVHERFHFSIITRYEILRGLKAKGAFRQIELFESRCRASVVALGRRTAGRLRGCEKIDPRLKPPSVILRGAPATRRTWEGGPRNRKSLPG